MPNFMPLCLIILLYQEFNEKSTFWHDTDNYGPISARRVMLSDSKI